MTKEELQKVLENHKHWLCEDVDDWKSMRANLYGANLSSADLRSANLCGANLCGADLCGANLSSADLSSADLRSADLRSANLSSADLYGANLYGANLSSADLYGANLSSADLYGANLYGANLYGANLSSADLRSANLCGANLSSADLSSADLCGANLCGANLHGVNLHGADLCGAEHLPYIPMVCPEEGEFIGWKKASYSANKIVKLLIPADAKRSSATTRKCRCSKAKVLEIYNLDGTIAKERKIESNRDKSFIYKVGETVEVSDFDDNRWEECSTGIHFFINRREALDYKM